MLTDLSCIPTRLTEIIFWVNYWGPTFYCLAGLSLLNLHYTFTKVLLCAYMLSSGSWVRSDTLSQWFVCMYMSCVEVFCNGCFSQWTHTLLSSQWIYCLCSPSLQPDRRPRQTEGHSQRRRQTDRRTDRGLLPDWQTEGPAGPAMASASSTDVWGTLIWVSTNWVGYRRGGRLPTQARWAILAGAVAGLKRLREMLWEKNN